MLRSILESFCVEMHNADSASVYFLRDQLTEIQRQPSHWRALLIRSLQNPTCLVLNHLALSIQGFSTAVCKGL